MITKNTAASNNIIVIYYCCFRSSSRINPNLVGSWNAGGSHIVGLQAIYSQVSEEQTALFCRIFVRSRELLLLLVEVTSFKKGVDASVLASPPRCDSSLTR